MVFSDYGEDNLNIIKGSKNRYLIIMGLIDRIFGNRPKCPRCGKSMRKLEVANFEGGHLFIRRENLDDFFNKEDGSSEYDTYICKFCGTKTAYKRQ